MRTFNFMDFSDSSLAIYSQPHKSAWPTRLGYTTPCMVSQANQEILSSNYNNSLLVLLKSSPKLTHSQDSI